MFVTYSHTKFHLPKLLTVPSLIETAALSKIYHSRLCIITHQYHPNIGCTFSTRCLPQIISATESQPSVAQLTTSRFRHVVTATMKFNTQSTAVSYEYKDDIKVRTHRPNMPEVRMRRQTDGTMISYVYFFPSFHKDYIFCLSKIDCGPVLTLIIGQQGPGL